MDSDVFYQGWSPVMRTLVVSVFAYSGLLFMLRVSGKRTLAKLNAFDLVVTVALGSTLASIILSRDVALTEGLVALAALVLLQFAISFLNTRWPPATVATKSQPRLLLLRGEMLPGAMESERVTEKEILQAARQAGAGDLGLIEALVLETDGSLSVIRRDSVGGGTALSNVLSYTPVGR